MYDVVVVGGGPAGLSAALMLGRCRRKVIVLDSGTPRNSRSHGLHGYLTRDGILPGDFLAVGQKELSRYSIEMKLEEVRKAKKQDDLFEVTLFSGEKYHCRKLLLATGVKDDIPELPNIDRFYGSSIFHCPYCDGWEVKDKPLAAYGKGADAIGLALMLQTWSKDIALFTDGIGPRRRHKEKLEQSRITVYTSSVESLEGKNGELDYIQLADGTKVERKAMFFSTGFRQQCSIIREMDCSMSRRGVVKTDKQQHTNIKGLYVAGDASIDMHFAVVAAAEGTKAAVAINKELQEEGIF